TPGHADRRLGAILNETKLRQVLSKMLNEHEFLSPYGIRSLARYHTGIPLRLSPPLSGAACPDRAWPALPCYGPLLRAATGRRGRGSRGGRGGAAGAGEWQRGQGEKMVLYFLSLQAVSLRMAGDRKAQGQLAPFGRVPAGQHNAVFTERANDPGEQ